LISNKAERDSHYQKLWKCWAAGFAVSRTSGSPQTTLFVVSTTGAHDNGQTHGMRDFCRGLGSTLSANKTTHGVHNFVMSPRSRLLTKTRHTVRQTWLDGREPDVRRLTKPSMFCHRSRQREPSHGSGCDNPPRKIPYYRLRPIHFGN
jgi:hypothetical protein